MSTRGGNSYSKLQVTSVLFYCARGFDEPRSLLLGPEEGGWRDLRWNFEYQRPFESYFSPRAGTYVSRPSSWQALLNKIEFLLHLGLGTDRISSNNRHEVSVFDPLLPGFTDRITDRIMKGTDRIRME